PQPSADCANPARAAGRIVGRHSRQRRPEVIVGGTEPIRPGGCHSPMSANRGRCLCLNRDCDYCPLTPVTARRTRSQPMITTLLEAPAKPLGLSLLLCCLLVVGFASISGQTRAEEVPWKAGIAKAVITPEKSVWLAGYGSKRPPDGKLHDLWMKAL